ncbi:hypothetical protein TSUD_309140 [Trifolium subterraneum]|nr:hypothetical protein TSUD_309140 [Trifolium subterraneum]
MPPLSPTPTPPKKKRSLAGMPDIAENPTKLSPPSSNASTSTSCCSSFSSLMTSLAHSDCPTTSFSVTEPTTLSLFTPLYLSNNNNNDQYPLPHYSPALSATALLQKAAQMGSRSSNSSLLHALGLKESSVGISNTTTDKWNGHGNVKQENELVADYLGLGLLPCGNEIMGSPDQPMTRDLLGLSMGLVAHPKSFCFCFDW